MVVVVTVVMAAVIGAVLYARQILDFCLAAARRLQLRTIVPGTPVARLDGWRLAYDDVLGEGCAALGIENLLESTPAGSERDAERLRIEYLLGKAGLRALHDVAGPD